MFRRLWTAIDRLVASINGLADRFEAADRQLAERIDPAPPQLPAAQAPPATIDGTATPAAEGEAAEAPKKGRKAVAA